MFGYQGKRTIRGLLLLHSILNLDFTYYIKLLDDGDSYDTCGWAEAFNASRGAYSRIIKVQKPDPRQPSSSPEESPNKDDKMKMVLNSLSNSKQVKLGDS